MKFIEMEDFEHDSINRSEKTNPQIVEYEFDDNLPFDDDSDIVDDVGDRLESEEEDSTDETLVEEELTDTDSSMCDTTNEDDGDDGHTFERAAEELTVRRSSRSTKDVPPQRFRETTGMVRISSNERILITQEYCEPRTFEEAMSCPDRDLWKRAMEKEIKSLHENATWEIASLPKDRKAVGSKWVFKRKMDGDGKIVQYKARLVAKGFSQVYGADYDEVFDPVAKQTTFRTLLSIAARRKLIVKHVDVKSAYLYGDLAETIYMKQPTGLKIGSKK